MSVSGGVRSQPFGVFRSRSCRNLGEKLRRDVSNMQLVNSAAGDRAGIARQPAPSRLDRVVMPIIWVVFVLLFAGSVALVWRLGIFDAHTRASNAQILAAALGLVGVLVTASLTFVGVLLKHSIDARTLHQSAETEKRL